MFYYISLIMVVISSIAVYKAFPEKIKFLLISTTLLSYLGGVYRFFGFGLNFINYWEHFVTITLAVLVVVFLSILVIKLKAVDDK